MSRCRSTRRCPPAAVAGDGVVVLAQEPCPPPQTGLGHHLGPAFGTRLTLDPGENLDIALTLEHAWRREADRLQVAQEVVHGGRPESHGAPDGTPDSLDATRHRAGVLNGVPFAAIIPSAGQPRVVKHPRACGLHTVGVCPAKTWRSRPASAFPPVWITATRWPATREQPGQRKRARVAGVHQQSMRPSTMRPSMPATIGTSFQWPAAPSEASPPAVHPAGRHTKSVPGGNPKTKPDEQCSGNGH